MEGLTQELKKPRPVTDTVKKLLKLTFSTRRKVIDEYMLHATELLREYPFLRLKAWISNS